MSDTISLFTDAWKIMSGRMPAPAFEDRDGVVSCFGNEPLFFLNASILTRPAASSEDLRSLLKTVKARSAKCRHLSGAVLREDWAPAGWEQLVLEETGLVPVLPMTDMAATEILPPRRPPAKLDIRRVENDAMGRELAELNAHAYEMPLDMFDCIANMRLWHADSYGFVGYADGKPVSCAAAFPAGGTVYIAFVATHPEARGRGYAETVVRHTIAAGQQGMGLKRTTLHATDMGFPVYRSMGYVPGPRLIFLGPAH